MNRTPRSEPVRPTPAQEKALRLMVHGDGHVHYGHSGHWFAGGHDEDTRRSHPLSQLTLTRMEKLGWIEVVPQPGSEWSFQAPRRLTKRGRETLKRCTVAQTRRIDLPDHMLVSRMPGTRGER